jgi:hypothetical protein
MDDQTSAGMQKASHDGRPVSSTAIARRGRIGYGGDRGNDPIDRRTSNASRANVRR